MPVLLPRSLALLAADLVDPRVPTGADGLDLRRVDPRDGLDVPEEVHGDRLPAVLELAGVGVRPQDVELPVLAGEPTAEGRRFEPRPEIVEIGGSGLEAAGLGAGFAAGLGAGLAAGFSGALG